MSILSAAVFGVLFCTGLSAAVKVKEDHRKAFFGEDVHIPLPAVASTDVVFRARVTGHADVVLMQNGEVVHKRAKLLNQYLILDDVGEEDEGTYFIKNTAAPTQVKHVVLIVRDCSLENTVKYGDHYHIQLHGVTLPISLEFRYSTSHINHTTESPPLVLMNQSSSPVEDYKNRITVNAKSVTLHKVTGMDEGSYTVLDMDGKIRMRNCLNVKEHHIFAHLKYDKTLKINLYLDNTKVSLAYIKDTERKERLILDQGKLVMPMDPALDGRISIERSIVFLKQVRSSDMGVFRVRDQLGFHISDVHLEVDSYKFPPLTPAMVILPLLGLVALFLLVCLLSCQIKVRRRAEKSRKIMLIAQQAGKGDGDAFRQVVTEAYTRFTEDSITQSQWDQNTDNTEVEIKGLEVSKAGRYQTLSSDKNFLEMSDSGVEFTSSALPLDSDTDVPLTYASHKPLLDSVHSDGFVTAQPTIAEGPESNSRTPDSVLSGSPASLPRVNIAGDIIGQPDGDLIEVATPDLDAKGPEADVVGDGIAILVNTEGSGKECDKEVSANGEAPQTSSGAGENATT